MKIENRHFIVSGGASGLGKQVVCSLIAQQAVVSASSFYLSIEALANELVQEYGADKCYFPGPTDVTNQDQVQEAISKSVEKFPNHILGGAILSSGIVGPPQDIPGYGPDNALTSFSQFQAVIQVNLLGTYCVAQKVSEKLLKNEPMGEDGERGIIITVSSILGLDGTLVAYGTSKAGVAGLTLPLAKELSTFGIRVMNIAPGVFDTPMIHVPAVQAPVNLFPNRYGQSNEFANLVLEIIRMPMLNGSVIRLDGALRG